MISFCKSYVSDTTAGMAVQTLFDSDGRDITARFYAQLTHGGEEYALLFSGTVDTTFADGCTTVANDVCDPFVFRAMRVGVCVACGMAHAEEPSAWQDVTFSGERCGTVHSGAWLKTDPIALDARAGDMLCVEYTMSASGRVPCHPELQIPSFVRDGDRWVPSTQLPLPVAIGVRREAPNRVTFLGDSITQGIGATPGAYRHWAALVAEQIGGSTAFWNLGIGFARSGDAASDGVWLARAKQADTVVLCLGVNDILRGVSAEQIVANLTAIIDRLHDAGCRVLLQSVPPFEFLTSQWAVWRAVNAHIGHLGDRFFDNTAFLCDGDRPRYGGHPNDDGCAVWAQALVPVLRDMME